jgi:hypothetical protein
MIWNPSEYSLFDSGAGNGFKKIRADQDSHDPPGHGCSTGLY